MKLTSWAFALFFFFSLIPTAMSAGGITGTVTFTGQPPVKKKIRMDGDAMCVATQSGTVYGQNFVLGEGNTLGNVFVQLKTPPPGDYKAPETPVVIDQKGCNYSPHVLGVMAGQPVKVLNPDGTLHNVHALSKVNREINLSMPKSRTEAVLIFKKPEPMFALKCDVHPWMGAWMAVMAHPFFTVTGPDGKFSLENIPDGTYTVQAWQEKLGMQEATVVVAGGNIPRVDFSFSAPGAGN